MNQNKALAEAFQFHQAGDLHAAESGYRQILKQTPNHPDTLHLLGLVEHQRGNYVSALEFIQQAIKASPNEAAYYNSCGESLLALGEITDATEQYQKSLLLNPDYDLAHNNLGNVFARSQRYEEAMQHYQKALLNNPQCYEACLNLGALYKITNRPDEAAIYYLQASKIQPNAYEPYYNLGNIFKDQHKLEDAIAYYQKTLKLNPDFYQVYNNLGNLYGNQGNSIEAIAQYKKALAICPDYADAHYNMAITLGAIVRLGEAKYHYQQAVAINPNLYHAYNNLGNVLRDLGQLDEAISSFRKALEIKPDYETAFSNLIYTQQFLPDITLQKIKDAHQAWDHVFGRPLKSYWGHYSGEKNPNKKLTLGFVSGDFRIHPVGYFTVDVLDYLSKECGIICYATHRPHLNDEMTVRFQNLATQWKNVQNWTDAKLEEEIRNDQIDILFDLTGHNAANRLTVFARKPAPVQISWAGYMATTGLQAMDYIMGDPYEIPETAEPYYQEKVIRMPHSYITYQPPATAPDVSALPALQNGYLTFGSFNILAKLSPEVIQVWSEVLKQVPDARLILKTRGLEYPNIQKQVLTQFGTSAQRITCLGHSSQAELLPLYNQIDIQLDPFPFSGNTTTLESLWMGVPVITMPGETFASRHSFSSLSNVGLTEFIADNRDEYIQRAVYWSQNLDQLNDIRMGLRQRMLESPLCDAKGFSVHLLHELRKVWQQSLG